MKNKEKYVTCIGNCCHLNKITTVSNIEACWCEIDLILKRNLSAQF